MSQSHDDVFRDNPHLAEALREMYQSPSERDVAEVEKFLKPFESIHHNAGTLAEHVKAVVTHYATQGGRWLKQEEPKRRKRRHHTPAPGEGEK